MMAGPSGFRGAPLSKALLIATVSTSVIVQAAYARRRSVLLVDGLVRLTSFQHPGELLCGAFLAYYFRIFERQMGTAKYGAYILITCGIAHLFQLLLATAAHRPSASGLYWLLFSNLVAFFLEVPSLQRFTVFGISLSEKAFVYLAGMQLLFSNGQRSVAAGVAGMLAGVLYHSGFLGLRDVKLGRAFGVGTTQRQQIFVTPAVSNLAGSGGGLAAAAAQPPLARQRPLVEPSPEAVQQLVDMGFDAGAAAQALRQSQNNIELALQSLL